MFSKFSTLMMTLGFALAIAACGEADKSSDSASRESSRGKAELTKININGSCNGFCGDQSQDGCWCDVDCNAYGDCCKDKADVCGGSGKTCRTNEECDDGMFCKFNDGNCQLQTLTVLTGKCQIRPPLCDNKINAPVCGCNNQTYRNVCFAANAGVSVAYQGKCKPVTPGKCKVSGCSKEICAEQDVVTACVLKPEFDCLKYSKCGNYGIGGVCDWQITDEYLECLNQLPDDED
jgi:eight-cysteine-cluster-containing protein